ncbi:hypothetical protein C8F01DRAFT_1288975 [Mycena amicta]|nr:hypothetical protein C8F01DRAFT_1288975 [Mycena amicta]
MTGDKTQDGSNSAGQIGRGTDSDSQPDIGWHSAVKRRRWRGSWVHGCWEQARVRAGTRNGEGANGRRRWERAGAGATNRRGCCQRARVTGSRVLREEYHMRDGAPLKRFGAMSLCPVRRRRDEGSGNMAGLGRRHWADGVCEWSLSSAGTSAGTRTRLGVPNADGQATTASPGPSASTATRLRLRLGRLRLRPSMPMAVSGDKPTTTRLERQLAGCALGLFRNMHSLRRPRQDALAVNKTRRWGKTRTRMICRAYSRTFALRCPTPGAGTRCRAVPRRRQWGVVAVCACACSTSDERYLPRLAPPSPSTSDCSSTRPPQHSFTGGALLSRDWWGVQSARTWPVRGQLETETRSGPVDPTTHLGDCDSVCGSQYQPSPPTVDQPQTTRTRIQTHQPQRCAVFANAGPPGTYRHPVRRYSTYIRDNDPVPLLLVTTSTTSRAGIYTRIQILVLSGSERQIVMPSEDCARTTGESDDI